MHLPLISPSDLNPEQRPLYEDMKRGIMDSFAGYKAIDEHGALTGPWNPWLHFPDYGRPTWDLVKALWASPHLPRTVREVVLLVTAAHFHAGYEVYSHVLIAEARGLSDDKIMTIAAGERPSDLTRPEAVAYDVASALVRGAALPKLCYRWAVGAFGQKGAGELIFLVAISAMISVIVNGFDVPTPEEHDL